MMTKRSENSLETPCCRVSIPLLGPIESGKGSDRDYMQKDKIASSKLRLSI